LDSFAARLIVWQRTQGRHDLPWQRQNAYRIWLSEIMLQQTQVATVIPYYLRFIASFPDIARLAAASEEQVLAHWSGLGYYARGRNLHRAARIMVERHGGEFPRQLADIMALPGVGRSTAAAICALVYHERCAILDGNVKRVLARYCGVEGWPGMRQVEQRLWRHAEALLPQQDIAVYTQALMDLGATVCTRSNPRCAVCPVRADCVALHSERTAELPTARARKKIPERRANFLLLLYGNDILLEKRAPSGIWGGLWCPPQTGADKIEELNYLRANGLVAHERIELTPFVHVFTHFKLHITPVLLRLSGKPLQCAEPGCLWLDAGAALEAAIPAPVRHLLQGLERALSGA